MLLRTSVRKSRNPKDGEYTRQAEDDRFIDYTGAMQSVVTSGGVNDSGMFETNLHDERVLPFEGAGAVSTWKLDLPAEYPVFDYSTVRDVIVHIRYTARQGVDVIKVNAALKTAFGPEGESNLALFFSLRHDFPTEWSAFINGAADTSFTAVIRRDYFPYFVHGKEITITGFELYGRDVDAHRHAGNPVAASSSLAAMDISLSLKDRIQKHLRC
jgi:hypothetical protein